MSAEIFDIKCPYDSCMNILSEDQIKSYVDASDFAKYLIFKENKLIQEDEAIRWCIRPVLISLILLELQRFHEG